MLYIIATPIGNLEDITLRAIKTLKTVDFVLAEDTRKTGLLLNHFGIRKNLVSFYEHNEIKKIPWAIDELKKGRNIALISSAGTPTISDPGYKLVRECRFQGLMVTSLPGASSVSCGLSLSSLGHDKFLFLGYLPRKTNERKKLFLRIKNCQVSFLFFESPFRITSSLKDMREILGNLKVTIAREMTKKFEEVLEVSIDGALEHFTNKKPKGEFTIIAEKPLSLDK